MERSSRDGDRGGGPLTTFGQPLAYSTYMVQSSFVALLYDIILISDFVKVDAISASTPGPLSLSTLI